MFITKNIHFYEEKLHRKTALATICCMLAIVYSSGYWVACKNSCINAPGQLDFFCIKNKKKVIIYNILYLKISVTNYPARVTPSKIALFQSLKQVLIKLLLISTFSTITVGSAHCHPRPLIVDTVTDFQGQVYTNMALVQGGIMIGRKHRVYTKLSIMLFSIKNLLFLTKIRVYLSKKF